MRMDRKLAIQRAFAALVVIVIVIIGAVSLYFFLGTKSSVTSVTNGTSSSSSPSSSAQSSASSTSSNTLPSTSSEVSSTTISSAAGSSNSTLTTSTTTSSSNRNQTLTLDDSAWPTAGVSTISPSGNYPNWPEGSVWQTLINFNLNSEQRQGIFQLVPDLATNWTVSADAKTFTFNLRQGVSFSNGDPFNAYVVWTNFYLYSYELGNSTTFWSYLPLFNFSSVVFGPATMNLINQSGLRSPSSQVMALMSNTSWPVYVSGPNTIVFNLVGPYSFYLNTFSEFSMQTDPTFLFAHGGPGTPTSPNTYFELHGLPGTGPYKISNAVTNAYVEFQQSNNYWGKNLSSAEISANPILDPGHFQTILVRYTPSDTSRYIDLLGGTSQISVISGSNLQQIQQNAQYRALTFNSSSQVMMGMNTKIFPTNITDVRLAIVHAINYSQVIDNAIFGHGIRYVGPNTPIYGKFYDPGNFPPYDYNLSEAAGFLKSAGFPNGTGLPALTLMIDSYGNTWEEPAAEVIQSNLASIGVTLNIQVLNTPTFEQTVDGLTYNQSLANPSGHPDMTFDTYAGYAPDFLSPADFFTSFVSQYSAYSNYAIYDDPAVDNAINLVTQTSNQTQLLQAFTIAQQHVYNDAPYAWLFVAQLPLIDGTDVYNTKVISNFYMDPNLFGTSDIPVLNTVTP